MGNGSSAHPKHDEAVLVNEAKRDCFEEGYGSSTMGETRSTIERLLQQVSGLMFKTLMRTMFFLCLVLSHFGCVSRAECKSVTVSHTVVIPAGTYRVGCANTRLCADNAERTASVAAFEIDRQPVLLADYVRCVKVGACPMHAGRHELLDEQQVAFVEYPDAVAFCRWRHGDLPSPEQWELAGRGRQGFLYPWGNDWDETKALTRAVFETSEDTAIIYWKACELPEGQSPFGVQNLVGGAPEFVRSADFEVRGSSSELIKTPEDFTTVKRQHLEAGGWARFRCVYTALR